MAEFVEDQVAWPTMVKLAGCLCTTLETRGLPGTCQCTVVPGAVAVLEACGNCGTKDVKCGGQGWVRFVNEFPSRVFPQPDNTGATCSSTMAYVLEIGVARCLPTGSANSINGYTPPSLESLVESTRLQMADKAAMLAAIRCCLDDADSDLTYSIGQYTTLNVSSDCGGGMWTVTIWSA